jgi:hypothetical protein
MTNLRQHIDQMLMDLDESVPLFNNLDEALVGFTRSLPTRAVYSYQKLVTIFVDRDGMDYEDACEHVERNCELEVGERYPMVITDLMEVIRQTEAQDLYCRPNYARE